MEFRFLIKRQKINSQLLIYKKFTTLNPWNSYQQTVMKRKCQYRLFFTIKGLYMYLVCKAVN